MGGSALKIRIDRLITAPLQKNSTGGEELEGGGRREGRREGGRDKKKRGAEVGDRE